MLSTVTTYTETDFRKLLEDDPHGNLTGVFLQRMGHLVTPDLMKTILQDKPQLEAEDWEALLTKIFASERLDLLEIVYAHTYPDLLQLPYGNTPLMIACAENSSDGVARTLEAVEDDPRDPNLHDFINRQDVAGNTALHFCTKEDRCDAAAQLLSKGAKMLPDRTGLTPLFYAIQSRDKCMLRVFKDYPHWINQQDSSGRTPLMHALTPPISLTCVAFILKLLPDVEIEDSDGRTALDYAEASEEGFSEDILEILNMNRQAQEAKNREAAADCHAQG